MLNYFNTSLENLGDVLFGEHATDEDLIQYVAARNDQEQETLVQTVNEAMLFELNDLSNNK